MQLEEVQPYSVDPDLIIHVAHKLGPYRFQPFSDGIALTCNSLPTSTHHALDGNSLQSRHSHGCSKAQHLKPWFAELGAGTFYVEVMRLPEAASQAIWLQSSQAASCSTGRKFHSLMGFRKAEVAWPSGKTGADHTPKRADAQLTPQQGLQGQGARLCERGRRWSEADAQMGATSSGQNIMEKQDTGSPWTHTQHHAGNVQLRD